MHELLAPLIYVLNVDLDYLFQLQKLSEDCFSDEFDGIPLPESDDLSNYGVTSQKLGCWE